MSRQSDYWDKRSRQRYLDCEKMTDEYLRKNAKMLNRAKRNIQQEIINVYKNYRKNGIFNKQDLLTKLPKHQSDEILKKYSEKDFPRFLNNNYKSRINRLQEIQCQIYDEIKKLGIDQQNECRVLFSEVIDYSYNKNLYDTQKGLSTSFEFTKIDENMINNLLETKWYGNNYSSRIWANNNIFANQVGEIIGGALISGQGVEKTARQVRERFGVHDYYARRLAQTETNYFHNQADAMAYKEMGVDRYVYVATLDLRTSEVCREMDGEIIKYSDMKVGDNFPPLHPNCRSSTRGYIEEYEKQIKRRGRDIKTGKNEVFDNITYKEWLQNQTDKYGKKKIVNKSNHKKNFKPYNGLSKEEKDAILNSPTAKIQPTSKKFAETVNYKSGKMYDAQWNEFDPTLLRENKEELQKLIEKYPQVKKHFQENPLEVYPTYNSKNAFAGTNVGLGVRFEKQTIKFNKTKFTSLDNLKNREIMSIKTGFNMPFDEKKAHLYTINHEFGHVVQSVLSKRYVKENPEIYNKFIKEYPVKGTKEERKAATDNFLDKAISSHKTAIEEIAKTKYNGMDIKISEYAEKNNSEWFAEVFANSQGGKPNALGMAMNDYLEEVLK